ncbi:MAG: hypothetical protein ACI4AD_11515 [Roseburia sp.]
MAKYINNMNELAKALQPVMKGLVNQLADEVDETLNYFLNDYYTGWTPESYRRTEDFLRSAVKTEAKMIGNKCVASVYIDYESMDDYVNVTGYQVATWANEGLHGGLSVSHKPHVWNDTMDETINNGSLLKTAIAYLKSKGFSVRV